MSSSQDVRVCLIDGSVNYAIDIKNKIKDKLKGHELSVYGNDISIEFLQTQIMSQSCFAPYRIFILKEFPKYKGTQPTFMKKFKELLENVPDDCFVILDNFEVSEAFSKWMKELPHGKVFESDKIVAFSDAAGFIIAESKKHNKEIQKSDAVLIADSLFLESKQINIDRLLMCLVKLFHYVGNRKIIKTEDVMAIVVDSSEFVIWNLFNCLDSKDYCGTALMLNKALDSADSVDEAVNRLLYTMMWRYKLLLYLKDGQYHGKSVEDIKRGVSSLYKLKRTGSLMNAKMEVEILKTSGQPRPVYSEAMIMASLNGSYGRKPTVSCYNIADLYLIVGAAEEALEKIREGSGHAEVVTAIDSIFMMVCDIADKDKLSELREKCYD